MTIHQKPKAFKITFDRKRQLGRYSPKTFTLIPLHMPNDMVTRHGRTIEAGKAPVHPNWTQRPYNSAKVRDAALRSGRNVGVRLPDDVVVIDIDPRNGGDAGFGRLCLDIGFDESLYPTVVTGSGGRHLYARKPADLLIRDTLDSEDYAGVEFKSVGRQVVAAGSIHPNGKPYLWSDDHPKLSADLPMLPKRLLKAITRPARAAVQGGGQLTPAQLAELLEGLDASDFSENSKWLQLAMACHHATAGEGRQEFLEWSASDPAYADCAFVNGKRWDSMHAERDDGVTYKTLNKFLRDAGSSRQVMPSAADIGADFDDEYEDDWLGREAPASNYPEFEGDDGDDDTHADGVLKESAPLADWQFLMDSMQFVHNDGIEIWNREQFGMKFGHLAPKDDVVRKIKQGKIAIRKYDKQVYIPKAPPVTTFNGKSAYNIWRDSGMTPKAGDHQWFLDHVAYMFPDQKSQDYVLDFMAQLIQSPDVKIHFALLIQSREGIGKGALATILRRIIGKRNTVEPSNDEVTKNWTGWQESAQLAIINELMAGGSAVVLNRLKAPITEPFLRIEKKFGNAFDIPNHMNIFGMTNFKDALPIRHDDRRWLILYSAVAAREPHYYNDLFDNIADDDKVAAVMHYLMERIITLNPKAPAPMTAAKRDMADLARTDIAILLRDMFEERRKPFHIDLVRMADVVAKVKLEGEKHANKTASAFLDELGAVKLDRDTNADKPYQLYAVRDIERYQAMGRAKPLKLYLDAMAADDEFGDEDE